MPLEPKPMAQEPSNRPLDVYFRLALATLIIYWCFLIARPFLVMLIWASIIAVSLYPVYKGLSNLLRGRKVLTSVFMILILIALFVIPSIQIGHSLTKTAKELKRELDTEQFDIPDPDQAIADLPVVGNQLYSLWMEADTNFEAFLEHYREPISNVGGWLLKSIIGVMGDLIISIIAVIIAGGLMVYGESIYAFLERFANRLIGDRGHEYISQSRDTILSVVKGILLIALIQAALAFVGLAIANVPAAGVWAVLILIAAIVQLPVMIVTIPIIIYGFSYLDTTPAIIFTIYIAAIGLIDNILKPILLGRGLETPMLVILIGALGGLALHGILGLFVGPVILSIGYRSVFIWMDGSSGAPSKTESAAH